MEAKHLGVRIQRQALDELQEVVLGVAVWRALGRVRRVLIRTVVHSLAVVLVLQEGGDQPSVLVVRDSASLVALAG